jgi:hypothetical protein
MARRIRDPAPIYRRGADLSVNSSRVCLAKRRFFDLSAVLTLEPLAAVHLTLPNDR